MLETMMIAFREGMEAFLIVAISLAYLERTDRAHLRKPVFFGVAAAMIASALLGVWLEDVSENPLTEGLLALTAGVLVGTFTLHMIRAAKNISNSIRAAIDTHAAKNGAWAAFGIFLFVMLMVTREGMETVLMISAAAYQSTFWMVTLGIVLGLALAALMGWCWVRKSHLIHIGRFLQVSAIFLILFSAQMLLKGLHEISETGLVPLLSDSMFHTWTEDLAEDNGVGSAIITYSLAVVPLAWLAFVTLRDRFTTRTA